MEGTLNKGQTGLFAEERKMSIVGYVNDRRKATVRELSDQFAVSDATIRNDLRELEKKNYLIRTHGGVLLQTQTAHKVEIDQRYVRHSEEKRRIAREAVELIRDGDSIVLDTGTTTYELARMLHQRNDVTVVTNDLQIALLLEQYETVEVVLMGGLLRRNFHCTVGGAGRQMLSALSVDKAFMGANSVSAQYGASTPDISTSETKIAMLSIANHVVLLCDHSKLNHRSLATFAQAEDVDTLITDSLSEEDRLAYEQQDIEVVVAR